MIVGQLNSAMDATTITNQRLTTIVLILRIILLALLVIGIVAGFLMMNGGMMGWVASHLHLAHTCLIC